MARVVLSSHQRQPIAELRFASNIVWRKALNSVGYASFDLPLTDPFATPTYLNPGVFIHIFNDSTSTNAFNQADWGGQLCLDYELKPKEGIISCRAAGIANLLNVSVVAATTLYMNMDVGSIVTDLVTHNNDNAAFLGLTNYTVSPDADMVSLFQANFGDNVYNDIEDLTTAYACDFEVRPDFTWAFYTRQGVDNPNLVARYGNNGNVQVDSTMHQLNSELFNRIYVSSFSSPGIAYAANQSSIQEFGYFSEYLSADQYNTYVLFDEQTIADNEIERTGFPPVMMDSVVLVNTPLLPFNQINLGDRILFESPASGTQQTTITPLSATATPLTLYLTTLTATDLLSANQLVSTTTLFSVNMSTHIGLATGFGEVRAQGTTTAWPALTQPANPTGFGFLYDTNTLNTVQLQAGSWSQFITLQCGDGLGVVGNIQARWYLYHSLTQTYSPIGTTTLSAQAITATITSFSLPPIGIALQNTGAGDMLYQDVWVNVTANSTNTSASCIEWVGITNMLTAQQADVEGSDLSGFIHGGTTLSQDTTQAWHGNASLKVVTPQGTFQSVSTNSPANLFLANGTYTFSAFMKSSTGTPTMRFYCQANDLISGNTSIGTAGTVTLTTSWQRYSFVTSMPAVMAHNGFNFTTMGMRVDTGSTSQQVTFWMDGMQITTGGVLAPWVPGGIANTFGLVTPGYIPTSTQTQTMGAIPMLTAFNGLQRIIAVDYDDRKLTMTLTMGNAVYKIVRGRLHEVRLYT